MAQHFDILIKGAYCLLSHPKNPFQLVEEQMDIGLLDGQITAINTSLASASADNVFKANGLHILPGLIDTQVHFREPGMEKVEDIESGSRSALMGGITGFFEMPNTRPPTIDRKALDNKIQKATGRSWCDFAFFVGASPTNIATLPELEKSPACPGTKIFMGSSTGSLLVDHTSDLESILQKTSRKLAIHSEDEQRLRDRRFIRETAKGNVHKHNEWRDPQCALLSTEKIVSLAKKHNRQVHILHVTTKEEIHYLSQHQKNATVEVTPQHLSLSAPECYDKLGTLAQMNPPIRDTTHQEALWKGLNEGVVTMLGSDHAPHSLEAKKRAYPHSPSGMPGTQTMLPIMLDHVNNKRLSLKKLTELLAVNPHRYYGMKNQGLIRQGFKANLTVIDLKKQKKINKQWLQSKCKWSPFENKTCLGWPIGVILKGQWAMREEELVGTAKGEAICFH